MKEVILHLFRDINVSAFISSKVASYGGLVLYDFRYLENGLFKVAQIYSNGIWINKSPIEPKTVDKVLLENPSLETVANIYTFESRNEMNRLLVPNTESVKFIVDNLLNKFIKEVSNKFGLDGEIVSSSIIFIPEIKFIIFVGDYRDYCVLSFDMNYSYELLYATSYKSKTIVENIMSHNKSVISNLLYEG